MNAIFNHDSMLPISSWPKVRLVLFVALGLTVMGQSCSISIGGSRQRDGGLYRSDDRGQGWHQKVFVRVEKKRTLRIDDLTVMTMVFDPSNSQKIYLGSRGLGVWRSDDAGEHWQATSLRSGTYRCIAFDPDNSDIMYTAAGSTALKSLDAGQTWTTVYNESQPNNTVNCIAVDPAAGNRVWATTNGGKVIFSDDYGKNWTLKQTIKSLAIRQLYLDRDGSGRVYIFATNAIYQIDSGGQGWTDLTPNLKTYHGGSDIRSVSILGTGEAWYLGTLYGPLKSLDRGQSWTPIPTLVNPRSVAIENIIVNPRDTSEIFITAGLKLHHTTDGGNSWSVTNLPGTRQPVHLVFDPENVNRLYYGTLVPEKK